MSLRCLLCLLLLVVLLIPVSQLRAQCTSTSNSFPYSEDFEIDDGGWTTGGVASDWVWGTPSKRIIDRAASGVKCWITGGLQNTVYNDNENSWLMSPCFDFSGLSTPYIHFKVFWETERKYDGANMEYSINGGQSWLVLGSNADNNACPGSNWFNTVNVTTLGADGWSGNIQTTAPCPGGAGGGMGNWVSAGHALPQLAGLSSVRFRFRFAAGNRCNDYDGFAVDDIWIGELAPADAQFSFSCSSSRTASFSPVAAGCGNSYTWNFGDPSTGSMNTSSSPAPQHAFSGVGDFPVTLTVTSPSGATATVIRNVRIIDVIATTVSPVRCNGGTEGSLSALVLPAGAYTYSWSTLPEQTTQAATGLGAGTYTVQIRGVDVCPAKTTGILTDPSAISFTTTVTDARCGGANGDALITVSGATAPYNYNWIPAGASGNSASTLLPGDYRVGITDAQGCSDTARFVIGNNNELKVSLGSDTVLCAGESLLLYPGPFAAYRWQNGSTDTAIRVAQTGSYSVRVTDADGCTASDEIKVTVDCSDVHFPTAFTPDNNGRNDRFGPLGNVAALSDYSLTVFGRWGQVVFRTSNPFERWDGSTGAHAPGTQVYVWVAQYKLVRRTETQVRKGTVLLVR